MASEHEGVHTTDAVATRFVRDNEASCPGGFSKRFTVCYSLLHVHQVFGAKYLSPIRPWGFRPFSHSFSRQCTSKSAQGERAVERGIM